MRNEHPQGAIRVGISGYDYPAWRGNFYPADLPARARLAYVGRTFTTIELNGTFYSLKSPEVFRRWYDAVPDDFAFAVKGSRFITHNLKLRHAEQALANFYASGVLALGHKTGPFLWQLPATYRYDRERVAGFLALLPADSSDGARLARRHDDRVAHALLASAEPVRYRHALEARHPSYFTDDVLALLASFDCALVIADTAGTFPYREAITADFVYVRLHGSRALYASGYTDDELAAWADRLVAWAGGGARDVYVYFDNDAQGYAPWNARSLQGAIDQRLLGAR